MFQGIRFIDEARFRSIVAIIIAFVTLLTAGIALLQSDASSRDSQADRDTKRYTIEILGRKISGANQVNFDHNSAYQSWYEFDSLMIAAEVRGDEQAAERYRALRDDMMRFSPILGEKYFDPETGEINVERYEVDTYLNDVNTLSEYFEAASAVKSGWGDKSTQYVLHLTLLAVALFMFGLSITIANEFTRWIFSGVGMGITLVVAVMALQTWLTPVYDLRQQGTAIANYVEAMGLQHQGRDEEAIELFNKAIAHAPTYTNAFIGRAESKAMLDDAAGAIADLEQARQLGENSSSVAGDLGWYYYIQGDNDKAIAANRDALSISPDELWIQFDLALALLDKGDLQAAQQEYAKGMDMATQQVTNAYAKQQQVPSHVWWGLDDAAYSLDSYAPDEHRDLADEISSQLKSLSVALEYSGAPPTGELTAELGELTFYHAEYNDEYETLPGEQADTFEFGTDAVVFTFDYDNMRDTDEFLLKVYVDGVEDPSWRLLGPWELGESGQTVQALSLAYSDVFVLPAGDYTVELYINNHFAQSGNFSIIE